MKTLDELRREIDRADKDLLKAYAARIAVARQIGEVKRIEGKPVTDRTREENKLKSLKAMSEPESTPYIEELYEAIFATARKHEEKTLFGVLGKSLPHTYSPLIHSLITDKYAYTVIEREETEIEELWQQGKRGVYGGFNVTIPYKKTSFAMCDELTDSAKTAGAVNTVVFDKDGKSLGANTDIYGFKFMLESEGIDVKGKTVLVLGTGGAAHAIKIALSDLGAGKILNCSRTGELNYTNVYEDAADTKIIVNCTPVGMYPDVMESPVDVSKFQNLEAVCDIIYNPAMTKLLYDAGKLGLKTAGGLPMLVAQAFKSAQFFMGARSDAEAEALVKTEDVKCVCNVLSRKMKNITVIGMPGSGKTKFARELASHLSREAVDLDDAFFEEYQRTAAETINLKGEDAFRREESAVALKYLSGSGLVISCGGGIVTREENFFPLKCNSVVIYNERPLEVLAQEGRPLSAANGTQKLFEERRGAYEFLADMTIHVDGKENVQEFLKEAVAIYDENTCS